VMYPGRDVRLSIVQASQGKVGSIRDLILLRCFHYDATTGKYSLAIREVLRIVAALFVVIVGSSLGLWVWRDVKKSRAAESGTVAPPATGAQA